jgi:hypothetical protein
VINTTPPVPEARLGSRDGDATPGDFALTLEFDDGKSSKEVQGTIRADVYTEDASYPRSASSSRSAPAAARELAGRSHLSPFSSRQASASYPRQPSALFVRHPSPEARSPVAPC